MLAFIRSQPNVVERLLHHIETPAFADLLVRIIQLDEQPAGAGVLEVCFISFVAFPTANSSYPKVYSGYPKKTSCLASSTSSRPPIAPICTRLSRNSSKALSPWPLLLLALVLLTTKFPRRIVSLGSWPTVTMFPSLSATSSAILARCLYTKVPKVHSHNLTSTLRRQALCK